MNDALLTFVCVMLTMLIETLGYVALSELIDSTEDNEKAREEE